MKRFFIQLGKVVLQIAGVAVPVLANTTSNAFIPFIGVVVNAILKTEAKLGSGNGAQKAEAAMDIVESAAPALIAAIESQTGKQLADDAAFAAGMKQLNDAMVTIMNSFQILPKKT